MTKLSGNKRRVHTRLEAHGSVCVTAVVLPAGANRQFGQRSLAGSLVPGFRVSSKYLVGGNTKLASLHVLEAFKKFNVPPSSKSSVESNARITKYSLYTSLSLNFSLRGVVREQS